jgi:hypothetical protein
MVLRIVQEGGPVVCRLGLLLLGGIHRQVTLVTR